MRAAALFLLLLLAFGCKSIKKEKSVTITSDTDSISTSVQEEAKVEFKSKLELMNQDWKMEDRTETHQAFDSAGITVFKPVVHTRSFSLKSEALSSSVDSAVTENRDSVSGSVKSREAESLDLLKESEGQEIIGQITEGVVSSFIPFWVKYVLGLLILLIAWLFWGWIRRKLKKEKDGIPPA